MKDYYSILSLQSNMSKPKNGFKLQSDSEKDDERSVAASSFQYKQRIDSMFDDTRSMLSGISHNKNTYNTQYFRYNQSPYDSKNGPYQKSPITNEVQNRINKMFQEVNSSELNASVEIVKFPKFPVAYMGSITLNEKVTSLRELQIPLKELYFNYIRNGRTSCLIHGSLEITHTGLKVKNYGNNMNRPSERLNPFSSIAVWAAVKFVFRKKEQYAIMNRIEQTEYAFMPLIADPESVDKISLYQSLSSVEANLLMEGDNLDNPPLFIVVMRESGLASNFDCHGFICSSSNDAIILAANLYTALVQAIPSSPHNNGNYSEPRDNVSEYPPKSVKGLVSRHISCSSADHLHIRDCGEELLRTEIPKRPPRKQKLHCSSESCSNLSSEDITKAHVLPTLKNKLVRKHAVSLDNINNIKCTPSADIYFENNKSMGSLVSTSSKQLQAVKNKSEMDGGDILTKVAIPRSKSFLNASGPFFSRYTKGMEGLADSLDSPNPRKTNVVSPLGLNELFQEFKQEGLYSMNDILDAIIDPDGMSFNDLKPIYKEFVLKLALTLTKDELYQRSKSIMQKQKHKKRLLDRRENIKKSFISGNVLKKALRRSVTNLKYSKYKQNSLEFTSVLFSSSTSDYLRKRSSSYSDRQLSISAMSSVSSRDKLSVRKQRSNGSSSHSKKNSGRSRRPKSPNYSYGKKRDGRSSTKDRVGKKSYLHNSSSGYISCSECSYSSDSCTCSSTEKCYCSLGTKRISKPCKKGTKIHDISPCECDTDSCFESDKCYCNQSSFESSSDKSGKDDIRRKSSNSLGSLINGASGGRDNVFRGIEGAVVKQAGTRMTDRSEPPRIDGHKPPWPDKTVENGRRTGLTKGRDSKARRQSSASVITGSFRESRGIKGANFHTDHLRYNRDKIGNDDTTSENKVLVVSARDPSGKVVYMGQTRAKSVPQDLNAILTTDDALCVKKTAEIAALFSSSNENIIYNTLEPPDNFNEKYFKSSYVETNLESSLGYLP